MRLGIIHMSPSIVIPILSSFKCQLNQHRTACQYYHLRVITCWMYTCCNKSVYKRGSDRKGSFLDSLVPLSNTCASEAYYIPTTIDVTNESAIRTWFHLYASRIWKITARPFHSLPDKGWQFWFIGGQTTWFHSRNPSYNPSSTLGWCCCWFIVTIGSCICVRAHFGMSFSRTIRGSERDLSIYRDSAISSELGYLSLLMSYEFSSNQLTCWWYVTSCFYPNELDWDFVK